MATNDKKSDTQISKVISLHGEALPAQARPIKSTDDFLRFAESLVAFEKRNERHSSDSDQPAPRVTSLDGFAGKGKTIRLQAAVTVTPDDTSAVTPFPQSKGKPPPPGTT